MHPLGARASVGGDQPEGDAVLVPRRAAVVLDALEADVDALRPRELCKEAHELVDVTGQLGDARAVERSCRRISGRLPAPSIRDWAENTVTRLVDEHRNRPRKDQTDTGLILMERTEGYPEAAASPESEATDPLVSEAEDEPTDGTGTRPLPNHRLGWAVFSGALLGGGLVGLAWLLSSGS